MDKKRSQHFNFAFESLPVIFHSQTDDFFKYIERDGTQFLEFWWDHMGMRLDDDKLVDFEGTSYEVREWEDRKSTVIFVALPKPNNLFEAYYMALVKTPKKRWPVRIPNTRVYVLEYVPEQISKSGTAIGEITPRGRFIRASEDGPVVEKEAFLGQVKKAIWKK